MAFLASTYPNQAYEDLGKKFYPQKYDINFVQRLHLSLRAAFWFLEGDHETYIVFMAKIYGLQCLPSYALHKMFWYPIKKKKKATQTHSLVLPWNSAQKKKKANQDRLK